MLLPRGVYTTRIVSEAGKKVFVVDMDVSKMKAKPASNSSPYWYKYYRKFWSASGRFLPSPFGNGFASPTECEGLDWSNGSGIIQRSYFYNDRECATTTLRDSNSLCTPIEFIQHYRDDFNGWYPGRQTNIRTYGQNRANSFIRLDFGIFLNKKIVAGRNRAQCVKRDYWIKIFPGEVNKDGWAIVPKSEDIHEGWVFIVPKTESSNLRVSSCEPGVAGCSTRTGGSEKYIYNNPPPIQSGCAYINQSLCSRSFLPAVNTSSDKIIDSITKHLLETIVIVDSLDYGEAMPITIRDALSKDEFTTVIEASRSEAYRQNNIEKIRSIGDKLKDIYSARVDLDRGFQASLEADWQAMIDAANRKVNSDARNVSEAEKKFLTEVIIPLRAYLNAYRDPIYVAFEDQGLGDVNDTVKAIKEGRNKFLLLKIAELALTASVANTDNKILWNKTYLSIRESLKTYANVDLDSHYGNPIPSDFYWGIKYNTSGDYKKFRQFAQMTISMYEEGVFSPQEIVQYAIDYSGL